MNIEKLTTPELIALYTEIEILLEERNVIQSSNILEEFSKFVVIDYFSRMSDFPDLHISPEGFQYYNAMDIDKNRYKILFSKNQIEIAVYEYQNEVSDSEKRFEYLLMACFNDYYEINKIYFLNWEHFLQLRLKIKSTECWSVNINDDFYNCAEIIYERSRINESTSSVFTNRKKKKSTVSKSYTVEEKRIKDKKAYEPWSTEADEKLESLYYEGATIKELSKIFGRSDGGIRSRIKKLGLMDF